MGISSAGIGSGLDVNSIVTSLMQIESKPLTLAAKQKSAFQSEISAYGTLSSALASFQTTVNALSSASAFNAQNVVSANTAVFTATATGGATVGDYAVTVSQLATSQKLASAGFASNASEVGTGTMTISFGEYVAASALPAVNESFTANSAKSDVVINIDSSNNTLAGIRDAINALNSSVSATIVNNGTSNQLVITSKDTGKVNGLKISVVDDDLNNTDSSGLSQLAYDPLAAGIKNMTKAQTEQNALLNVDGIAVTNSSNTISDVIAGVKLNLLSTSSSSVNLAVTSNQEKVKSSVTAFVDSYNKLETTLRDLTKFDSTGKSSGVLLGDATIRSVTNQIKSVMTQSIATGGSITSLSQIGVTFQRDGKLALDSSKLSTAVSTNFSEIPSLFAASARASDALISFNSATSKTQAGTYSVTVSQLGSSSVNTIGTINGATATGVGTKLIGAVGDNSEGLSLTVSGGALGARGTVNVTIGYAAQLDSILTKLLSRDGILTARTDGIKSSVTRIDKQTESINTRLAAVEARYRAQFTRLDTVLSSMSTTSSFLTQQIASINANK